MDKNYSTLIVKQQNSYKSNEEFLYTHMYIHTKKQDMKIHLMRIQHSGYRQI